MAIALEILVPVALLGIWEWWTSAVNSFYFPPLHDIVGILRREWIFDNVRDHLLPSIARLAVGYAAAVVGSVVVGTLLGLSTRSYAAAKPIIEFLRSIPPPALLPIAIVVVGVGDAMRYFLIAFVCAWPILLNTLDGIAGIDRGLLDASRQFGITGWERVRRVVLPAASPAIVAGMRTSLSVGVLMMVVSEMVAATNGIGFLILNSEREFAIPEMWAGIIALGVTGYALNLLFLIVERRLLRWHRGFRSSAGR